MKALFRKIRETLAPTRRAWGRIQDIFRRSELGEEFWEELEEALISADVGPRAALQLVEEAKRRAKEEGLKHPEEVKEILKGEIASLLNISPRIPLISESKPAVIIGVGVNGVGKTLGLVKLGWKFRGEGLRPLVAAADTFRAAAIDQLKIWASQAGLEVIAHNPGGDPGAVVFDAIQAARKRGNDVVLVDTAGRLHTKYNLMEELKKIRRVVEKNEIRPFMLLFLDATTGQNGLAQAHQFTEKVGIDGIFLTKIDTSAKGGVVLGISAELKLPLLFLGTGQKLEDLLPFDPQSFASALLD